MEKQKIFWVVLSVSVFVVIVLVVGVYLLRQKPQVASASPGAVNPISGPGPQIYEYSQQKPQGQTGTEQKPGETQTMHFYIGEGAEKPGAPAPSAQPQAPGAQPQAPGAQAQPQTQPQAQSAQTPGPASHPRTVAALPRKVPVTVKTPVKPRQARKAVDYWIQTGAYKSQSKADELISMLADKGLTGKVFSYDSHSGTYYRVRIGPYTNQGEADKFLSIVKQIQGLETSYVSQVGGMRNLN